MARDINPLMALSIQSNWGSFSIVNIKLTYCGLFETQLNQKSH